MADDTQTFVHSAIGHDADWWTDLVTILQACEDASGAGWDWSSGAIGGIAAYQVVLHNGIRVEKAYTMAGHPAIGMTVEAADQYENTPVIHTGEVINPAWTWTPGDLLYVSPTSGGAGLLTTTRPGSNAQLFAIALSATRIYIIGNMTQA